MVTAAGMSPAAITIARPAVMNGALSLVVVVLPGRP